MAQEEMEFQSPEELSAQLETIGLKLHARNRIAGGESGIVWHLAETIRALGKLATRISTDPELLRQYGDGYQAGLLPTEAQQENFLGMLAEALAARK